MESSVRLKYGVGNFPGRRGAVLSDAKEHIPVKEITALYKCCEGKEWYLTFTNSEMASSIRDLSSTSSSGMTVNVESLDKGRLRFRVYWFPFHMKGQLVEDYMEQYGSNIELTYKTQYYDCIKFKTGTMTGNMICRQKSSLPYRGNINGRVVLISHGKTDYLRCGSLGRATCPDRQTRTRRAGGR